MFIIHRHKCQKGNSWKITNTENNEYFIKRKIIAENCIFYVNQELRRKKIDNPNDQVIHAWVSCSDWSETNDRRGSILNTINYNPFKYGYFFDTFENPIYEIKEINIDEKGIYIPKKDL